MKTVAALLLSVILTHPVLAQENRKSSATAASPKTADWPQLLGPGRDGKYLGPPIAGSWPKDGPKVLWKKSVGSGYSGPAVSKGRLVLFHRVGDEERIECFDAKDGKRHWTTSYATGYQDRFGFDDGPRGTPTIAGDNVYCYGAEGVLSCVSLAQGRLVWRVKTHELYRPAEGFFGAACSPLVDGARVFVNVGDKNSARAGKESSESGTSIVAFDAKTGKTLWTALEDEASYSSGVAATIGGERRLVFFTRSYVVVLDPDDGKIRFRKRWRPRISASVNAATPLVVDKMIFASTSYSTGGLVLEYQKDDTFREVWSGEGILSSHYSTSVEGGGFLYGLHGRQEAGTPLRCVELATGKVRWSESKPGSRRYGSGSVILAGDKLVLLTDEGEVVLVEANAKRFKALSRGRVLSSGIRACPALADGRLYARDTSSLVCVELTSR